MWKKFGMSPHWGSYWWILPLSLIHISLPEGSVTIEKQMAVGSKVKADTQFVFDIIDQATGNVVRTVTIEAKANASGTIGSEMVGGLEFGKTYVVKERAQDGYILDSISHSAGTATMVAGTEYEAKTAEFTLEVGSPIKVVAVNSNASGSGISSLTKVFETNGLDAEAVTFDLYKVVAEGEDQLVATGTIGAQSFTGSGNEKSSSDIAWDTNPATLPVGDYYVVERLAGNSNYQFKKAQVDTCLLYTSQRQPQNSQRDLRGKTRVQALSQGHALLPVQVRPEKGEGAACRTGEGLVRGVPSQLPPEAF